MKKPRTGWRGLGPIGLLAALQRSFPLGLLHYLKNNAFLGKKVHQALA